MTDTARATAFIDWGRWVADCPYPGCTNAKTVAPGQEVFVCDAPPSNQGACGRTASIEWPDDPAAVMSTVATLPEAQRSWRPTPEPEGGDTDAAAEQA